MNERMDKEEGPAPLYELYMAGAIAMCDAWAVDRYPVPGKKTGAVRQMALVSYAAPASTMRGMRANLKTQKEGGLARLMPHAPDDPRTPEMQSIGIQLLGDGQYSQVRVGRLRGYHHAIAIAAGPTATSEENEEAPDDIFYVFAKDEADGPLVFYREFIKRSPTPSLPLWAETIWDMCRGRGEIRDLESFGIHGWRCDMRYEELERAITAEVRAGHLQIEA